MKPPQWLGAIILSTVLVIAIADRFIPTPEPAGPDVIQVHGHVGNLKVPFFNHPEVQRILREKYGLELSVEGMATTEMLCPDDPHDLDDVDFLFAGEQSQIAIYEACQNRDDPHRNVFLSPMVIYSWADSIDALVREGIARKDDSGAYYIDMPLLLDLLESGRTWKDLGFPHRPMAVKVYPTDPDISSSGRTFAGLLANTMNCLEVVDLDTVDTVLPSIFDYYQRVGFLEPSSEALFRSYMTLGEGARPLVALIESQISEYLYDFAQKHTPAEYALELQRVSDHVRMLYPEPTVWTSHPVIARTAEGERVLQALLDPELQQLGWEITGFRPAVPGVMIDITKSAVPGILPAIESVIDTPGDALMALIKEATKNDPGPGHPRRDCGVEVPGASPSAT
jgi:hypothetical protein